MKDTDEVKFTVGQLRKAAEICPTVKETLKTLCPEAFAPELGPRVVMVLAVDGEGDVVCISDRQTIMGLTDGVDDGWPVSPTNSTNVIETLGNGMHNELARRKWRGSYGITANYGKKLVQFVWDLVNKK